MLGRILSLFMIASITVAFAAGADMGAGTKAEELNVPAIDLLVISILQVVVSQVHKTVQRLQVTTCQQHLSSVLQVWFTLKGMMVLSSL